MKIYIGRNGQQQGPYSIEELNKLAQSEPITGNDMCWHQECADWIPLSQLPGFIPTPPPTPATVSPPFQQKQPSAASLPTAETGTETNANDTLYYLVLNSEQAGPYTLGQLCAMWQNGKVNAQTKYCAVGGTSWRPLIDLRTMLEIAPVQFTPPSQPPRTRPPLAPELAAAPTATLEWHYSTDGHRFGPVTEDQINELIKLKKITEQSLVWNKSMPDWQLVLASKFANLVRDPNAPPPLTGAAVNNTIIWVLAFAPLIGGFLEEFFSGMTGTSVKSLWFITLVVNISVSYADEKKLIAAGHDTSKMGAAWLVPVYMFKRAQILKHNYAYFIVWCVLFVLLLIQGSRDGLFREVGTD